MKNKFLALSLAAILALPTPALADTSAEIAPQFPALFASNGIVYEPAVPISRARFSMLTLEAFRTINNGVFPSMEAKNIFTDVGNAPEDIFVVMLYGMGIVNGVGDNSFAPRKSISRQEACTILTRAKLRQNPSLNQEILDAKTATDGLAGAGEVAAWAQESVAYLYAKGILPLKNGSLAPNEVLTAEEAMHLCTAYINAK